MVTSSVNASVAVIYVAKTSFAGRMSVRVIFIPWIVTPLGSPGVSKASEPGGEEVLVSAQSLFIQDNPEAAQFTPPTYPVPHWLHSLLVSPSQLKALAVQSCCSK